MLLVFKTFFKFLELLSLRILIWFKTVSSDSSRCIKSIRIRSFSGPYFPAFGLNTERYSVFLRIYSKCGKVRTRKTPCVMNKSFQDAWVGFLETDLLVSWNQADLTSRKRAMLQKYDLWTSIFFLIFPKILTTKWACLFSNWTILVELEWTVPVSKTCLTLVV